MMRTGLKTACRIVGIRQYTSASAREKSMISASFKVQDSKDFIDRVKNAKVPVIVDFFAT